MQRRSARVVALYILALLREFRWTLLALCIAVAVGTALYSITPHAELGGNRPPFLMSLYGAWMAMLAQPIFGRPETWYLTLMCAFYPVIGAVVIGEGVVRLAMLMMSKRRGEKEWIRVMASTYRDHVVVCGLGHLGFRVLQQLVATGTAVVALEHNRKARFVSKAKELRVPVLIRDMKEDKALLDAGIQYARAVVIATNDALGNIEVALDSKRMNPHIRVVMRMFDEQVAAKLSSALSVDVAFSSSTLAAPVIAALALQPNSNSARVISSLMIAGVPHVAAELHVKSGSSLAGQRIGEIEKTRRLRVLAMCGKGADQIPPAPDATIAEGDRLVVHVPAAQLELLQ